MFKAGTCPITLTSVLAVFLLLGGYADGANVDLRTWSQQGSAGAGNWVVAADGSSVLQTINGAPTMFVSLNSFLDTTVSGSFGVEPAGGDDDFIGFVFGYNSPLASESDPVNDMDLILFDWKRGTQLGASAGFYLYKVLGTHNGAAGHTNELWPHVDAASLDVTQLGTPLVNAGWVHNVDYDFELIYQQTKIEIHIEGGTGTFATKQKVFDVDIGDLPAGTFPGDVFPDGRFGFYNHSQPRVRYESFTQVDDPILVTKPDDGGTLNLGSVRVGTTSAPGDLTITNGAEVDSMLTGTVSDATGEFAGPTPPGGFAADEDDVVIRQFTYTPTARGADTQNIDVVSDQDGTHTITLAGKGVGPVYADDSGGELDFQECDNSGPEKLLSLRLFNNSVDAEKDDRTNLTILAADITGDDAGMFSLVGLTLGTVIQRGSFEDLDVMFDPIGAAISEKTALLTFTTDQGAAAGTPGETFEINLKGKVVPEPMTVSLLALGAVALVRRRRR